MKRRAFTLVLAGTALAARGGSARAHPIEGLAATTSRDEGWNIAAGDDDKLVDTTGLSKMADRLTASGANGPPAARSTSSRERACWSP